MVGIVFIIVGVVLLLVRGVTKPSQNDPQRIPAVGIVRRRIQDGSYTQLYVEFRDQQGNVHLGKSVTYKSTKGKYQEGETANIHYFFSPKGKPFVVIDDPDLVSCEGDAKPASVSLMGIGIVLVVAGVLLLIL